MVTKPDSPLQLGAGRRQGREGEARRGDRTARPATAARRISPRRSLETLSGTKMTHVPFRGNAPALTEVIAGRVTFMFYPMVGIADQVAQKRLKVLAVSTPKRHPDYPTAPTMAESGLPGLRGVHARGRHRRARRHARRRSSSRLNEAIRAVAGEAGDPGASETDSARSPKAAARRPSSAPGYRRTAERWARVIKAAGVKAE